MPRILIDYNPRWLPGLEGTDRDVKTILDPQKHAAQVYLWLRRISDDRNDGKRQSK